MPIEGSAALGYVSGTGTFAASGAGTAVEVARRGEVNVSLWGTFVATVTLERSFDYGVTWLPLTYIDGSAMSWTAPMSTNISEPEKGVRYRFNCTSYTSGTVNYRISH
jgi:hypothetical protein